MICIYFIGILIRGRNDLAFCDATGDCAVENSDLGIMNTPGYKW